MAKKKRRKLFVVLSLPKWSRSKYRLTKTYARASSAQKVYDRLLETDKGCFILDILSVKELEDLVRDARRCSKRGRGFWPALDIED